MRKLLVILLLLTLLLPAACAEEMTLRVPNAVDLYFPEEEGDAQWTCALDDPEVVSVADQLFGPGELGDGFAFFDAGELYEQGKIGDEPDFSTAWDLYVEAAGTTSPNCKGVRNIGQWYEEGNDYVDQNYRKAAAFYNWAILLDDASSCYYLGNLYLQGYLSADGEPNYEYDNVQEYRMNMYSPFLSVFFFSKD